MNGVIDARNITFPYVRGYYTGNVCQWNITVRGGRKMALEFEDFQLNSRPDGSCGDVYVLVSIGTYSYLLFSS